MNIKKLIIIIVFIIFIGLNFPIKYELKDGGTIGYKSILWKYEKVRSMGLENTYLVGTRFEFLGIEIIDTTHIIGPFVAPKIR